MRLSRRAGPKLNGQTLAEFSRVQETAPEPSLRVKSAALWLYVKMRPPGKHDAGRHKQHPDAAKRPPTLYVFRVLGPQHEGRPNASVDQVPLSRRKFYTSNFIIS